MVMGLSFILVVGTVLRLVGLNFGLPNLYLTDEEFFVQPALRVADGHLDPGWYGAPGQPLIYSTGAVMAGVNLVVNWRQHTSRATSENYALDPTPFQTAGRAIPATAGVAMIFFVWLIGRRISERVGLVAATLTSTSFYLIDHSHIIRPDILQTTFILMAVYSLLRWRETGYRRWSLWLGVFYGLSITTKYPSLFLLPLLLGVAWYGCRRQWWTVRSWVVASMVGVMTVILSAPFVFLHPFEAAHDVLYEGVADHGTHSGLGIFTNLGHYAQAASYQLGTILALVAIGLGIVVLIRQRGPVRPGLISMLLIGGVWYLFCLSLLKSNWDRWLIPLMPVGFLLVSVAIGWAWSRRRLATGLVVLMAMVAPSVRLVRTMYGYTHLHTADVLANWYPTHLRTTDAVAVEVRSPVPSSNRSITLPNVSIHSADWYHDQGYTVLVLTSGVYSRIQEAATQPNPRPAFVAAANAYTKLLADADQLTTVMAGPYGGTTALLYRSDWAVVRSWSMAIRRGPNFWVYRLRP